MIEAIILAAGMGERLGRIKPLVLVNGEPALQRVIRTVRQAGITRIVVILGHAAETVREQVDLAGCRIVVNPEFESGMAGSLRQGIESLLPGTTGFLIHHADMPYVKAETVRAVVGLACRGARIAAPIYRGERGFPVFLDRSCCKGLLPTLIGDRGARGYIAQHSEDLVTVAVDDPGALRDIDRVEDLVIEEGR